MADAPEPRPFRPHGELFADAAASVVWAAIEQLTETDKHRLYERLTTHLRIPGHARGPLQEKVARAIGALREAHDLLPTLEPAAGGRPASGELSLYAYRLLHGEHGARLGWPDDASIRRWLAGTWNDCLAAAALARVDDGDALVREIGGAFTREEAIAAVLECSKDTNDPMPSCVRYLMWANRPDVKRRPGRRPRSQGPINRLFGEWAELLVAADLAEADAIGGVPRATGGGQKVYRRSAYAYSDGQLRAAMREVARRVGGSPTTTEYARQREDIFAEDREAGRPARAFPALSSWQKRFERWDDALVFCGLEPRDGRHNKVGCGRRRSKRRISDREFAIAIREAYVALGEPFHQTAYSRWRDAQAKTDKAQRRYRRLPVYSAIWQRFGTWQTACNEVLGGWDPATDPIDPGEGWTSQVPDSRDEPPVEAA